MQEYITVSVCYIFNEWKQMYWEVGKDTQSKIQSLHLIVKIGWFCPYSLKSKFC